ncbi:hypothetical protein C8Q80DRAFT_853860 [Daedaleopsis nitida]|nr:hypothetical protein C8Q80DRAFT_853860 [Daedaleopsis nitida]
MSSFSSSRVSSSPQSSPRHYHRSGGLGSRPRPALETTTSHGFRHRQTSTSAGSRGRYRDWDSSQEDGLPCSSKSRDFSPRNLIADSPAGHASSAFVARTPPSSSKVRSNSRASSSHNEISPAFRMSGLGRWPSGIQAHQAKHAPNGCTTSLPPLLIAQVPPASSNEPPSLSSSLTSPAPSLPTPRTPQSKRSPVRVRRYSAFVTPSASFSSFRSDTRSCQEPHSRCERHTPSPSPLSHASHEIRLGSHR